MDKSIFLKELGQNIVRLRSEKGWSQAELARASFKDRQSIERLENGRINPSIYYLCEIAEALEVNLYKILIF